MNEHDAVTAILSEHTKAISNSPMELLDNEDTHTLWWVCTAEIHDNPIVEPAKVVVRS